MLIGPSPCYIDYLPEYVGGFARKDVEDLLDMMDKNYVGWAHYLAGTAMQNAERPNLAQELEESFCSTDPVLARRFAEATFLSDNRDDLSQVPIPSLILQCSEDLIAPDSVGDYLHRHIPKSQFKQMHATGHCPHMSHPQETVTLIKNYLNSVNTPHYHLATA